MEGFQRAKRVILVAVIFASVALNIISTNSLKPATHALYEQLTVEQILHHNIEINTKSHIAANVRTIVHIPAEAKIVIHFHQNRSCSRPQLIGRLSGLFLSKVTWENENTITANGELFVVGHYNVPSPGKYFIEIIVTICQQLDMDVDVTSLCMVDPSHHRLTQENATIDADIESEIRDEKTRIGFWFNKINYNNSTPLYTRYQPDGCRLPENHATERCQVPMDTTRFDPYEFKFFQSFSLEEEVRGKAGRVCYVGASHSRVLTRFSNLIITKMGIQNFAAYHSDIRFASNLTRVAAQEMQNRCTKVVVGMGQWDVSRAVSRPTSFVEYRKHLKKAMSVFVKTLLDANIVVYFRNMQ